jgi:hypothetical protein
MTTMRKITTMATIPVLLPLLPSAICFSLEFYSPKQNRTYV